MNLYMEKAATRIKEIGIKKVVGASRRTLIIQYMGESILMTFLSLAITITLLIILLPKFNQITGKHLTLYSDTTHILAILAITIITGLISGSYPAVYLSGFKPALILKGKLNAFVGELLARKGLVVFQFTLSVILIVSVLIVYK